MAGAVNGEMKMNRSNTNVNNDAGTAGSGDAGSGDPAYRREASPHRLRRLHRVWPDREGNIAYLLTLCVQGRDRVLATEVIFNRLTAFLLDSPARYQWFPRRFVVMPDHLHLIARQGHDAVRLGQWVKALKAVVGGLERRVVGRLPPAGAAVMNQPPAGSGHAGSGDPAYRGGAVVGRLPPAGSVSIPHAGSGNAAGPGDVAGSGDPAYRRVERSWRWQEGFHDHKFRTPESEQRKWEYICLNPVRAGLVARPEAWPFGGEIFHEEAGGPRLVAGTPPLLEVGFLVAGDGAGSGDPAYRGGAVVGRLPPAGSVGTG